MRLFNSMPILFLRNIFIVLILVIISSVSGYGEQSVTLNNVIGTNLNNQLMVEEDITFEIKFTNTSGSNVISFYNGFRIYSDDGAYWQNCVGVAMAIIHQSFDDVTVELVNTDGLSADTIGFFATQGSFSTGFVNVVLKINIGPLDVQQAGRTICLDSVFVPPYNIWSWSTPTTEIAPVWYGPHCFEIACSVENDADGDLIGDECDNCPFHQNPFQEDDDNDGYGNRCDCNPQNPLINPETIWYVDADSDGWGDINSPTIVQCPQPDGHVINADDCDDTNFEIGALETWYLDYDSDGFGDDDISIESCVLEIGYSLVGGDCDDNNPDINPENVWYFDADNDTFGDINNQQMSCLQPTGYVSNNLDCDDSDATINPNTLWYSDSDDDGFGDPSEVLSGCTQPIGFVSDNRDCNDNDISVNPDKLWYADSDNDSFGFASETTQSCEKPDGFVENDLDCDDTNNTINPNTIWYADEDSDGYGNPEISEVSCTQYLDYVLNNLDCDDNDDSTTTATVWYFDSDSDGFGDLLVDSVSCEIVSGYVTNGDDNCVEYYNPDQADTNSNGIGDVCEDIPTGLEQDMSRELPESFALFQNYPNPFNGETIISFNIPYKTEGDLAIYNLLGERVYIISSGILKPGRFNFSWSATDQNNNNLPSGLYFYRLKTSFVTISKKMIYLK